MFFTSRFLLLPTIWNSRSRRSLAVARSSSCHKKTDRRWSLRRHLGGTSGNVLIDLSKDGNPAVRAFGGHDMHGFCALAGGVLGLSDAGQIALHAFGEAPRDLTVTGRDHETRRLTPALRLIADGMRIAVPLRNSTDAELAVLKVDLDQGAASWEQLGIDQRAVTLRTSDFPANMGKAVYFDRAVLRDNQVIVQSVGQFGQPRTGYRFGAIVQIDTRGAVVTRQIYWQDYTDMPDEKKRGFKGDFT